MFKKFFPLLAFVSLIIGILIAQLAFDVSGQKLGSDSARSQAVRKYEDIFKNLTLTTTDNNLLKPSAISRPIVILNFWASWCVPCLKELPSLINLQNRFKNQLLVVGINSDFENAEKKIKEVQKKYGLNYPQVMDIDQSIMERFEMERLPLSLTFYRGKVIDLRKQSHNFMSPNYQKILMKYFKKERALASRVGK